MGIEKGKFTAPVPCAVAGCERHRRSSAPWSKSPPYCAMHADRVRQSGDVHHGRWPSTWNRFVDRVRVKADGCWQWMGGGTGRDGEYGQFWYDNRTGLAHRYAYETMVGPIPDGLELDHLCRVKKCVNPTHLEPVTPKTNIQRAVAARKGATS